MKHDKNYVSKFVPLTVDEYKKKQNQEQNKLVSVKKEQPKGLSL